MPVLSKLFYVYCGGLIIIKFKDNYNVFYKLHVYYNCITGILMSSLRDISTVNAMTISLLIHGLLELDQHKQTCQFNCQVLQSKLLFWIASLRYAYRSLTE